MEQQLLVAAGEPLALETRDPEGHAVEARLYAEHPLTFLPQAGTITALEFPDGVRVDAGVAAGDEVPVAYDPMIAKLVATGETRDEALDRLAASLADTRVAGVVTNLPFLRWLVDHPAFRAGDATTAFLTENPPLPPLSARAAGLAELLAREPRPGRSPRRRRSLRRVLETAAHGGATGEPTISAPMPGTVIRVLVSEGDRVEARQPLVVVEAMKMETPLVSPFDGTVKAVHVAEGDRVTAGMVLVELED